MSPSADASFDELAGLHLRPLRELVMEARWGAAPTAWLEVCLPAVHTVRRFAEELGRAVLLPLLDELIGQMERARSEEGATLAPTSASALADSFEKLSVHLPLLGALDTERDRRAPVIVRSLLLQVPGCNLLMIERLAGAGLMQLAPLLAASADELAVATGIDRRLAGEITDRLARYREQNASTMGTAQIGLELEQLEARVAQLRQVQKVFEEAAESWSEEAIASKRRLRGDRAMLLAQIELTLARLGEVERIQKLERMTYARKLAELDDYLRHAGSRAAAGA